MDDEELLKAATGVYFHANPDEKAEFFNSLSDEQLKQVKPHIHSISLFESINRCREEKTDVENSETNICKFYDSVLELLEIGEHIENDILIDLLKRIGKHKFEEKKKQPMQTEHSKNDAAIKVNDEVKSFRQACYSWPESIDT